jgi:hypothetical protein
VEIIVEERPWQPPFRFRDEDMAPVSVVANAFRQVAK